MMILQKFPKSGGRALKDELCEVNKIAIVVKPGSSRGHSVKSSAMILDDTGEK